MSDQAIGKKEAERTELAPFLEAYEHVTGDELSIVEAGESPDFLCSRSDGTVLGIELAKIIRDPATAHMERILAAKEQMDPYETVERIYSLIERKDRARLERYVLRVESTTLVLQLMECNLDRLIPILDGLAGEFEAHGFAEIWLADYSGLDAYGDIELFGLFPGNWWGYHQRSWPDRKPYG